MIYIQMESLNWFYSVAKKLKLSWLQSISFFGFTIQNWLPYYSIWPSCHPLWSWKSRGKIIKGKMSRNEYFRVTLSSGVYSNTLIAYIHFCDRIGCWQVVRRISNLNLGLLCLSLALLYICYVIVSESLKSLWASVVLICIMERFTVLIHFTELIRWINETTVFTVKDYKWKALLVLFIHF